MYPSGEVRNVMCYSNSTELKKTGSALNKTPRLHGSVSCDSVCLPKATTRTAATAAIPHRTKPPLDARLQFRLSEQERLDVLKQADRARLTVSAYCRRRILGHQVTADVDEQMIRELRRLGGLLKHHYNQSGGVNREESARVLDALGRAIDRIAAS